MRGHNGTVVPLDPGGFWNNRQQKIFNASITASVALVRRIQPAMPFLIRHPAGSAALLAQFSARPWKLDPDLVLTELRGFNTSPSLDEAGKAMAHGPKQPSAPRFAPGEACHWMGPAGQGHAVQADRSRRVTVSGGRAALGRKPREFPVLGPACGDSKVHPRADGVGSL
jgi:hypothetical protein